MDEEDSTWTAGEAVGGRRRDGSLPATGAVFARHRIEAVIGRGGMGVVYRARNLALDRDRALKVIAPELAANAAFRARFQREARLAASLDHPNVVGVHEAGEEEGLLYLSMQLIEGSDLRRLVDSEGPLDVAGTARVVSALASALDAAHARGMVHRDVKPSNVLIEGGRELKRDAWRTSGSRGRASTTRRSPRPARSSAASTTRLPSSSRARRRGRVPTSTRSAASPTSRSPVSRRFRVLTRSRPSTRTRTHRGRGHRHWPPVHAGGRRCDRAGDGERPGCGRFGSAGEMAAAFEHPTGGSDAGATVPMRRRAPGSRRPALIAGGLLALAVVAIALVALLGGDEPEPGPAAAAASLQADEPIEVGPKPVGITVGERSVWVAYEEGVRAISPDAGSVIRRPTPVAEPHSVAVGFGSVWVASEGDDAVYRIDQGSGVEPQRIAVGDRPADLAVDERWVWVAIEGEDEVVRIHPSSNEVAGTTPVGDGPRSLSIDRGIVWTANRGDGTVSRVRSRTAEPIGDPIAVGQRPNDLAASGGSVWVVDNELATLIRLDSSSGVGVGDPVRVGPEPRGVAVGLGAVWVITAGDDRLTRFDPERPSGAREAVEVGREPTRPRDRRGIGVDGRPRRRRGSRVRP